MQVSDIMQTDVVVVRPDTSYRDCVETLLGADVNAVPVLDDEERLLGIVSEADVVAREGFGPGATPLHLLQDLLGGRELLWVQKAQGKTAAELMSSPVVSLHPADDLRLAARRIVELGVKSLPVTEGGRLVGIIARQDILRVFARFDGELEAELIELLAHRGFLPPKASVRIQVADGEVTVTGTVHTTHDADEVRTLLAEHDGVLGVHSFLTVEPRRATDSVA